MEIISSDSETESVGSVDAVQSTPEGPLVFLRLKPVNVPCEFYDVDNKKLVTKPANGKEKQFTFSQIFEEVVSQCEVYDECVKCRIDNEENFTIMTYGTSGSGKTYTLIGKCILRYSTEILFSYNGNSQELMITPEYYQEHWNIYSSNTRSTFIQMPV